MLNDNVLRIISDIFIGDIEGYYSYKSGPKLVSFFNTRFGFNDVYQSGFPSRWDYVVKKLKYLNNIDQFNDFLTVVLSKKFIMKDSDLTDIEAVGRISVILDKLNDELNIEGYKIYKVGSEYILTSEDKDLEFVGEGGFAYVYISKSTGVIVKKLKDDFKQDENIRHRFKREYDITKSLSDLIGVVKVYDFNASDYSYTMEKAERSLEEYINEFDHGEAKKIEMIKQILHIIKNVHDRNIIHRDISPNNILLFNDQLKISDFGLGKDLTASYSHRTMNTASVGQYYYCAPEELSQLKKGDKKSDVYALGSLVNFIMNKNPKDSSHFMRNPVEKAKNENPNMRYKDAGAFLQGIEESIRYYKDNEKSKLIQQKIKEGIYDDDIENFIYSLNAEKLCKVIIKSAKMVKIIIKFISIQEKRAIETLESIESSYLDVCKKWENYDNFAYISYQVIHCDFNYGSKEIASKIIYTIAYEKNRFKAQSLIDELLDFGIDPTLEEILKTGKTKY